MTLDGAYLMRSGQELVPMSEDRPRAVLAEGQPDWLEEPSREELSEEQIVGRLDTQALFTLMQRPYPTTRRAVLDQLRSERLSDPAPGGFTVRRMAAVLLARRLTDFPDVSRKAARVVVYSTNSKVKTKLDQTLENGYAAGLQSMVAFVMAQLPQNEVVEEAVRQKVKLLPDVVIRELVANALIHQDFTQGGASVMIEVYPNRVEISSPGEPLVPVERFIDGYQSRNERLADLMRRMHICEEKSSGIDQVVEAAETFQLPAPEFLVGLRRTSVIIHGHKTFKDMDREARIRACYQHCVLRYAIREQMTNQSLRGRFELPENKSATVSQVIAATIEAGLIKADEQAGGSRRQARYLPHWA